MEYLELRKRLKLIGLNLKEFSKIIGFSSASLNNWKNRGVPVFATSLIETLELLPLEQREKFFQEKLGDK